MTKPCLSCGTLTTSGSRCPPCRTARSQARDAGRASTAARGYGSAWQRLSRAVLERDGHVCAYCGGQATTADHVIPKAKGGTDDMANLVAACRGCNSAKRDRFLTKETSMTRSPTQFSVTHPRGR